METIDELRERLALEGIAKRLEEGQSRGKIARELNLRPERLEQLIYSDAFFNLLREKNEELAEELERERKAAESLEYEEIILKASAEAARELLKIMRYSVSDNQRRGSAKDIIDIAAKLGNIEPSETPRRTTFPASQLRSLVTAADEMDAQDEFEE